MKTRARWGNGLSVFVAITLLAPLVALGVFALRAATQSPLESADSPAPLIGTVASAQRSRDVTVAIAIEYSDALAPSAQAAGTATSVYVSPGDVVKTGTKVASVNDARLVAYASPTPLWRNLYRGSSGADVKVAQRLMASFGYYSGPIDGKAGYGTEKAFKAFNGANGYGATNGVLALGSVVWIGPGPVTVADVSLAAGDAVSPGTAIFTTTSSLADVKVTESASLDRDNPVELVVGDVATPYQVGSERVTDPEAVAAIADSLGTATEGTGTIRLVTPMTVGTIPASAAVSGATGSTCVFPSVDGAAVRIDPIGGSLGTIDVDPSLIGQPVLVNPREVREDLSCGS